VFSVHERGLLGEECLTAYWNTVELRLSGFGYPDWLGPSGKFVENSTTLTYLEITG
jgi:hypothetical protein